MSDEAELAEEQLPLEGAGQKLRRAREAAGMSVKQVAEETRIPMRHLEVIEAGDFSALPARTYAIGFSRTYAKAVGLDQAKVADQVRAEMGAAEQDQAKRPARFEPGDPARIPSRGLAWFAALAVVLLVVGAVAFFRPYFFPGSGPGPLVGETETAAAQGGNAAPAADQRSATPAPSGQVVFTSLEDGVWVKFYDGEGTRLIEKQMVAGESYTVPADAENPQLWTGQPESLAITIGGEAIGNLSTNSEIVRDVDVSAAALIARSETITAEAQSTAAEGADESTAEAE